MQLGYALLFGAYPLKPLLYIGSIYTHFGNLHLPQKNAQPMVEASRLVAVKIARGWQRRRFYEAFVAGLNEAEARSAETQTWIEFAVMAHYLDAETGQEIFAKYEEILANLRRLIDNADAWTF